jgi:hypothetical protein
MSLLLFIDMWSSGDSHGSCVFSPLVNTMKDTELFERTVANLEPREEETSLVARPWRTVNPI